MFFLSTRNSKVVGDFKKVVLNPIAEDNGGIFVPSFISQFDYKEIYKFGEMTYPQILAELLELFCDKGVEKDVLHELTENAFANFGDFGVPIDEHTRTMGDKYFSSTRLDENLDMASLTYGPTGCCKDYGFCLAAEFINYFAEKEGKVRSVIDISDNYSAISTAMAIRNKRWIKGFSLFKPTDNISTKALMHKAETLTQEEADKLGIDINQLEKEWIEAEKKAAEQRKAEREANRLKGIYDDEDEEEKVPLFEPHVLNFTYATADVDIETINKARYDIYNNTSLREMINLTFINELNVLNILAYVPAFFKMALKLDFQPFCVAVPTSNMSLGMAAYFAKKMGLPIAKIMLGVEKNNFFFDFQNNGAANTKKEVEDGNSSLYSNYPTNFERLLFYMYGANQASVKRAIQELETNGIYKLNDTTMRKFRDEFFVTICDNQMSQRNGIFSMVREKKIPVDLHFAISRIAANNALSEIGSQISMLPIIVFNTLDYRRNLEFVNASLGYEIDVDKTPWTELDTERFDDKEIANDEHNILSYAVSQLEKMKWA